MLDPRRISICFIQEFVIFTHKAGPSLPKIYGMHKAFLSLHVYQGCQTHFSSGATWRQIFLKRAGSVKKVSFLKKFSFLKKTPSKKFLTITKTKKIFSRAALNPFAGRMHNIKKNFLAGRMFDTPDVYDSILWQGCQTYGPRAACGPQTDLMRPARHFQNVLM